MIALNVVLMTAALVAGVLPLAWASGLLSGRSSASIS
jgi:hypothetical protein